MNLYMDFIRSLALGYIWAMRRAMWLVYRYGTWRGRNPNGIKQNSNLGVDMKDARNLELLHKAYMEYVERHRDIQLTPYEHHMDVSQRAAIASRRRRYRNTSKRYSTGGRSSGSRRSGSGPDIIAGAAIMGGLSGGGSGDGGGSCGGGGC